LIVVAIALRRFKRLLYVMELVVELPAILKFLEKDEANDRVSKGKVSEDFYRMVMVR